MKIIFAPVLIGFMAMLFSANGCMRPNYSEIEISVPQMGGQVCADLIRNRLLSLNPATRKGEASRLVIEVAVDISARKVWVEYNPLHTASINILQAISDLGFDANDRSGNAAAKEKLPENCL